MSQSNSNDSAEVPMSKKVSDLDRLDRFEKKDAPKPLKKKAFKSVPQKKKKINIDKVTDKNLIDISVFKKDLTTVKSNYKKAETPSVTIRADVEPRAVPAEAVPAEAVPTDDESSTLSSSLTLSDVSPVIIPRAVAPTQSNPKSKISRSAIPKTKGVIKFDVSEKTKINGLENKERLKNPKLKMGVPVKKDSYYPNNRKSFLTFMNQLFNDFKDEINKANENATCEYEQNAPFSLMPHQKIIRDYMNINTPYRGILLYHGLGSGKTCSSIALAEAMRTNKDIIIMTPASLQKNYKEELKKCGNLLYRKNLKWDFIDAEEDSQMVYYLSSILSLPVEYINSARGAWLVDSNGDANYDTLDSNDKKSLDKQLEKMIEFKYRFINYNGLQTSTFNKLVNQPPGEKMISSEESERLINNANKVGGADGDGNKYKGNKSGVNFNIFDGKVVIIDEMHNFVSRIVNKLQSPHSISFRLYELLLRASDVKIIALSGTPIINYPNEIAVLFNILRGRMPIYSYTLKSKRGKATKEALVDALKTYDGTKGVVDFIRTQITRGVTVLDVTRNPFCFENYYESDDGNKIYKGLRRKKRQGDCVNEDQFHLRIKEALGRIEVDVVDRSPDINEFDALPTNPDFFNSKFFNSEKKLKNIELLKRRISGLTSYFRSAQENLMPAFDNDKDIHKVPCYMSPHQVEIYEKARVSERDKEKKNAKKRREGGKNDEEITSTYRIFSRAFCNFVFPPEIKRPMPGVDMEIGDLIYDENVDELFLDGATGEERINHADGKYDADQVAKMEQSLTTIAKKTEAEPAPGILSPIKEEDDDDDDNDDNDDESEIAGGAGDSKKDSKKPANIHSVSAVSEYNERIFAALDELEKGAPEYLSPAGLEQNSPKFLKILENLKDPDHEGLHLIYSQFRTIEGIGVLKLILEANGFAEFKIKMIEKSNNDWSLDISEEDLDKPKFVLYTGTETVEEKEVVRNVFNGNFTYLPQTLKEQLTSKESGLGYDTNKLGEIIKIFMITASGAEGISLKNVRHVHITEPYWHPVRMNQVIGRARRICSHQELEPEYRNVQVFLYLAMIPNELLDTKHYKELISVDDGKTSDQKLNQICENKTTMTNSLLKVIKETAIDCQIHAESNKNEKLSCFVPPYSNNDDLLFYPDIEKEEDESIMRQNQEGEKSSLKRVVYKGEKYAWDKKTQKAYDYNAFKRNPDEPVFVGTFYKEKKTGKTRLKKAL